MIEKNHLFNALLISGLCCLLCGCGDSGPVLAPVTGFIMIDDIPLANATVTFQPESGRPSSGVTDEKGEFKLKYSTELSGAVVGPHKVSIIRVTPELMGMSDSQQEAARAAVTEPALADQYNRKSELTAEVLDEDNFFAFTLESDAAKKPAGD